MKDDGPRHVPVLLEETLAGLRVRPGGRWIDGTLGGGGHAAAILERSSPDGRLLGIDRDAGALERAARRLAEYGGRLETARGNFRDIGRLAGERGWDGVDGILLDLGFSSLQIDDEERGFSFKGDGRLDMRMDREERTSAWEVVNRYPPEELRRVFRDYGEEPRAGRIAAAIAAARRERPVETTGELAEIVCRAAGRIGGRIHPATRVFQALRMEVNRELESLAEAIPAAVDLLAPGGRLAVISYHSLEDRTVKETFRRLAGRCSCPPRQPVCTCGARALMRPVNRRPLRPSAEELMANRRSRSARLRLGERIGEAS